VAVWYATIAIFTFPWALLMPEVAFGFLLWHSQRARADCAACNKPRAIALP
jgi:hypothetical protein